MTDSKGNVVKNYNYDAFGNEEKIDESDKNPFRYGGEYWDKETGFYYLRARMYDPKIGRFINEDSVWGKDSDPLSLNLYTYCSNDPVDLIDPTGHMGWGQIDDLFGGIKDGMADSVKGIIKSPKVAYTIAKELIFGDLTLKQLIDAGIDGITEDYRYVINHGGVFNPFKDSTDAQVRTFGKHTGGIISDIALALTGAGAGKAAQALSKSKSGQKILKILKKVDGPKWTAKSLDNAANIVGEQLNGTVSSLKNGYKVAIPNGRKSIVVRIMDEGSGGRSNPYFRVSIDGKGSLTLNGKLSNDRALTHIDMNSDYLKQINNMINKYLGR